MKRELLILLKKKLFYISKSDFFRNSLKLSGGTTFAQLVSIGTAPILYRIYDKDDYGTLGYYMSIAAVIGALSTLQYIQPIMLEKKDKDAEKVLWLNRIINFSFSLLVALIIFIFHDNIIQLLNAQNLYNLLFLIPVSVFFSGQNEIYRVWANRKKKYNILAQNSILTAIIVPVLSISIGLIKDGPFGLFAGYIASQIIPALILSIRIGKKENFSIKGLTFKMLLQYAKKYKKFPLYSLPSDFVNRISNQLPVFMLGQFSTTGSIGVYNLCARILGLPLSLISNAISEVFKQRASEDFFIKGTYHSIFLKTVAGSFVLTILPVVITILFGPELFAFVFGDKWLKSGILAQYLIFYFMVKFIVSPVSYILLINNKLHIGLFKNLMTLAMMFVVFYIGLNYLNKNYINVIGIFGITYAILDIFYLYYLYTLSRTNKIA